ncbi:carbohydrate binding domain containing protein [Histomonas meleagridis]|uniref:carbohydrate binding domain containing protein n=1 Tax=Histomonas meleagridis TaxID=135588 RepID=UPI00355A66F2|nr:carbohydrate binding domain containing protein [Histomonas meleagridis]KAH0805893.1 carbohydrate binding domain containing protein [Histomonas meleagridis]
MFLFSIICVTFDSNYVLNPSFENGKSNWQFDYSTCVVTTNVSHSGNSSLYCHDTNGLRNSLGYQFRYKGELASGFYYKLSAWIMMRNCTSNLIVVVSGQQDIYALYLHVYNTANKNCSDGNCNDQWYYIEATTSKPVQSTQTISYAFGLRDKGTGEYWIDDISFSPILSATLLKSADVTSWRQEVYRENSSIIVDLAIKDTYWENGDYLAFDVDFINQATNQTELTLHDFTINRSLENIFADFVFDSTLLSPGYYNVSVTLHNLLLNCTEHTQTYLHVLSEKRDYAIYVDRKMRTIDHGKPFFPLGMYYDACGYKEEYVRDYIGARDSPFNIMVFGGSRSKAAIDRVYNITEGRVRVIDLGTTTLLSYKTEEERKAVPQKLADYAKTIKDSPGLFAYYHKDEPSPSMVSFLHDNLIALREADPDHPVYTAVNQRNYLYIIKEGLDCYGSDIYPVQNIDDFHAVYIVTYQGRNSVINNRANWGIPQFFSWKTTDATRYPNELPPTYEQQRQMTYQMIAGGANGIIYFDFGLTLCGEQPWQNEFEKVKKIANELKNDYVPIILSGNDVDPGYAQPTYAKQENSGRECAVRFFNYDGYDYVLVVNVWKSNEKDCTFFKPNTTSKIKILTGDSEITETTNITITLHMPAMDVTWLRITNDAFNGKHGLSDGAIAGIVIAVVAVIAIAVIATIVIKKSKKNKDVSSSM